jgi:hypothetical protein
MKRVQVTLTIDLAYPIKDIGRRKLREHIEGAVECWGGQLHPDDPLFDGIQSVTTSGVTEVS